MHSDVTNTFKVRTSKKSHCLAVPTPWSWIPWRRSNTVVIFSLPKKLLLLQLSVDQYSIPYLRSSRNNYLLTWLSDQSNEPLFSTLGSPSLHMNKLLPSQVFHLKSNSCFETGNITEDMKFCRNSKVTTAGDFLFLFFF